MIELDHIQGSDAWHKARTGIPTASHFAKLITAKTLKLSAEADKYENRLIHERLTGNPCDDFGGTKWIERGKELEGDAVQLYEMQTGLDVRHVGLILNDGRTFGASPDGLVGDDRGLELKCPKPETHIGYMIDPESLYLEYKPQIQGGIFVSGRKLWDAVSYHPDHALAKFTVEPDKEYQDALAAALVQLEKNIAEKIAKIRGA